MLEHKWMVRINCLQPAQLPLVLLVLLSGEFSSAGFFLLATRRELLIDLTLKLALQRVQSKGVFDVLRIYPEVLLLGRVERVVKGILPPPQPYASQQPLLALSVQQSRQLFQKTSELLKIQVSSL